MQGIIIIIILAVLLNTKPATKSFQKFVGTVQYTPIEQSGSYPNWQVALKLTALSSFVIYS